MGLVIQDGGSTYTKFVSTLLSYPVSTNLVALYDFGAKAASTTNLVTGGTQPTVSGNVVQNDYSIVTSASNGYISTGINSNAVISIAMVVTTAIPVASGGTWLMSNYQKTDGVSIFVNNTNLFVWSTAGSSHNSGTTYSGSAPTFLCGIWDGTNQFIHAGRANTLFTSATDPSARSSASAFDLRIGFTHDQISGFTGQCTVHMAAIHNGYALTSGEVNAIYQRMRDVYAVRGITGL